MQTNEFRVRPVTRYQLTHFQREEREVFMDVTKLGDRERRLVKVPPGGGFIRSLGEFLSVEAAEEVGVALQALTPGSTMETIEGRQATNPPKALAAAIAAHRRPQIGDVIPVNVGEAGNVDMKVYATHEWENGRRLLDCSFMGGLFVEGRGTGTVLDDKPYTLMARNYVPE